MKSIFTAGMLLLVMTFLTGVVYPLAMTGLAQGIFPAQANGSLLVRQNSVVGSKLIGQHFIGPEYFHSRPSAAGQNGYDAANSGGSNFGPTSRKLLDSVRENAKITRAESGVGPDYPVPSDLVTASGSGLDPDISPAAALLQAERIAKARGLSPAAVHNLIDRHITGRQLGLFGEPRVNVLELNLSLDTLKAEEN